MELNMSNVEQLINIIESANGEPQVIRDMILEGDAIDMIAYILNKPPATTTWKDVDALLLVLKDLGEDDLCDELYEVVYGVDTPITPHGA